MIKRKDEILSKMESNSAIFPINIYSDIKNEEITICPNVNLMRGDFNYEYFSANYYFYVKNIDYKNTYKYAFLLSKAIKLFRKGGSGVLSIISKTNNNENHYEKEANSFIGPYSPSDMCFAGEPLSIQSQTINENDLENFKKLVEKIFEFEFKLNDAKFQIMSSKYMLAMSSLFIQPTSKFIDLMTILEMLYTTKKDRNDIGKIIDLRLKHIFKNNSLVDENGFNFDITDFYKIRNDIVHEGSSSNLDFEKRRNLGEIVRESLVIYINHLPLFENNKLPKIKKTIQLEVDE